MARHAASQAACAIAMLMTRPNNYTDITTVISTKFSSNLPLYLIQTGGGVAGVEF